MITELYVIHDITAEVYSQPFHAGNAQVAKRTIAKMVGTPGSTIHDNPEDYRLYKLGEYDDESAAITTLDKPLYICRASDFSQLQPNRDPEDQLP